MGKLRVSRWIFDAVIGDAINLIQHDEMYEYYHGVHEVLEIRKKAQIGKDVGNVYVDFSGSLRDTKAFSDMYGIPRKSIVIASDWQKLEGFKARLHPVNLDYDWSLLNWNHEIHRGARQMIYDAEARYGSWLPND